MEAISTFEAPILLWIQAHRIEALNPIVTFITHLGNAGILWIGLTVLMMIFRKTRRAGVVSVISIVLSFTVANLILKPLVARTRPYEFIEGLRLIIEVQKDKSFPSGHATNALAVAWVMFRMLDKKYGLPALLLALVICWTRLYVGVHYPTDVLAGMLIGIASAEAAMRIVAILRRRFPGFRRFIRPPKAKKARKARQAKR